MSNHRAPRVAQLRRVGRAGAVITGGVLALSGLAAGTASADPGHGESDESSGGALGITPTTPVDGFVHHWWQYHYGEENFVGNETDRILSDPGRYVDIHLEMVNEMLGWGEGSAEGGDSGGY